MARLAAFALTLFVALARLAPAAPPNIVFIMSDDHAYQAVSAYGHGLNQTPNIDRIASEGMRFNRCYVTNSICGPSRACILTGKYSHLNGVPDNYTTFDGSQTTFPKLLQQVGYETALIGKWHLKSDPTGFDHWDIMLGQGKYYRPVFRTPTGKRDIDGYATHVTTDLALDWLKSGRDKSKPFLLMLHHKAPHRPWDPAPDQLTAFEGQEFPEPRTLYDNYEGRSTALQQAEMRIEQMRDSPDLKIWSKQDKHRQWLYKHMSPEAQQQWITQYDPRYDEYGKDESTGHDRRRKMYQLYLKDYLRCINSVDESVGAVLECLDQQQLSPNTIVVYTSDQGFYLGEHGWFDKRLMLEPSLRTPFVIRWPEQIDAVQVDSETIVSNVDFAATFLHAAGAEVPEAMQGRSFLPLLQGDSLTNWRKTFYYQYLEGKQRDHHVACHDGVTNGRHKLIHYYETDEWELYDLVSDPHEVANVYASAEYSNLVKQLKAELTKLRTNLKVPPELITAAKE